MSPPNREILGVPSQFDSLSAPSPVWLEADRLSAHAQIQLHESAGRYPAFKPLIDFAVAILLLGPVLPFIGLAWLLVKISSRGPGFYSQTRTGRGGLPYSIFKIRSMHHRVEEQTGGAKWSHGNDERIFSMGKILRRTHWDELPQIFNLLRGEMSLVGPRPERPEVIASKGLCDEVPGYDIRMVAKPGITGLAQLQLPADSDIQSVRRKVYYDLYYIRHQSLAFDVRIAAATLFKACGTKPKWLRRIFFLPSPETVAREFVELACGHRPSPSGQTRLQPVPS